MKHLSERYNVNYNTVRHILQLYNDFGRTRTKKYIRLNRNSDMADASAGRNLSTFQIQEQEEEIGVRKAPKINLHNELFIAKGPNTVHMDVQKTHCPLMIFYTD